MLPVFLGVIGAGVVGWAMYGRRGRAARARRALLQAPVPPRADATQDGGDQASPIWPGWPTSLPAPEAPPDGSGRSRDHGAADDSAAAPGQGGGGQESGGRVAPPGLDEWAAILAPMCSAQGVQLPYALNWISMESGGNPCEIGYPPARGPDGMPREMGIGQFYNPDDLNRLKLTSTQLRAYCVPGDDHEVMFRGKKVRGFSRDMKRPMTPAEMLDQARGQMGLIGASVHDATSALTSIGAGPAWSRTRRDFWRMVKLVHGLPSLLSVGLPRVNAKLGRPPRDWAEFRKMIDQVVLDRNTEEKRSQGLVAASLDNAERCASVFDDPAVA